MAIKGFTLPHTELQRWGIELRWPSFFSSQEHVSKEKVEHTKEVASAYICMEKVIERLHFFCILNHCLWFSLPHAAEQVVQVFAIFTNLSVPIDEWAVSSKVQSSSPFVIQDEHVQHQCSPYFVRLFSMESPAPLHCISLSHNYASSFLIAFKILSDETCFVCYIILAIYPLPLNAELSPYNFSILFLPNLCCITPSSR